MIALLAVVLARAAVSWGSELAAEPLLGPRQVPAARGVAGTPGHARPRQLRRQRTGELAILATRGIDVLDGYFSLYLPQLFLAVIVPVS